MVYIVQYMIYSDTVVKCKGIVIQLVDQLEENNWDSIPYDDVSLVGAAEFLWGFYSHHVGIL